MRSFFLLALFSFLAAASDFNDLQLEQQLEKLSRDELLEVAVLGFETLAKAKDDKGKRKLTQDDNTSSDSSMLLEGIINVATIKVDQLSGLS